MPILRKTLANPCTESIPASTGVDLNRAGCTIARNRFGSRHALSAGSHCLHAEHPYTRTVLWGFATATCRKAPFVAMRMYPYGATGNPDSRNSDRDQEPQLLSLRRTCHYIRNRKTNRHPRKQRNRSSQETTTVRRIDRYETRPMREKEEAKRLSILPRPGSSANRIDFRIHRTYPSRTSGTANSSTNY